MLAVFDSYSLLRKLVERDISMKYRGSAIGIGWALLSPLLLLTVFYFFLRVVLNSRWPGSDQTDTFFALNVFSGLLFHAMLAETMTRSTGIILGNPNYIKKVLFPSEYLPIMVAVSAFVGQLIAISLLLVITFIHAPISITQLVICVALLLLWLLGCIGVALIFAAIGTYFKDLGQIVGMLSMILMFMSPVFYPISAVPEQYRSIIEINPLTLFITAFRETVISQKILAISDLGILVVISTSTLLLGLLLFKRLSSRFTDAV